MTLICSCIIRNWFSSYSWPKHIRLIIEVIEHSKISKGVIKIFEKCFWSPIISLRFTNSKYQVFEISSVLIINSSISFFKSETIESERLSAYMNLTHIFARSFHKLCVFFIHSNCFLSFLQELFLLLWKHYQIKVIELVILCLL